MGKKITRVKTKLSKVSSPKEITEKLSLKKGMKSYPRSYRWREYDLTVIEDLIAKEAEINNSSVFCCVLSFLMIFYVT